MLRGDFHVSGVAQLAGVSRPTVYRWVWEAKNYPAEQRAFEAKLNAAYTWRRMQLEQREARKTDFDRLYAERWATPWKLVEAFEEKFEAATGEERSDLVALLLAARMTLT